MLQLRRRWRAMLSVLAVLASVGAAQDAAAAGLTWGKPVVVGEAPFNQWGTVRSIACPSTSLCVGVSDLGAVVRSTNPTAATPTWTRQNIDRNNVCHIGVPGFCPAGMSGISCPSTSLCVAVDGDGGVFVTTDPAAANPTWTDTSIDDGTLLAGVSCLSDALCVAVEANGKALVSHNPTAANPIWTGAFIDGSNVMSAVTCSATNLCVAVDRFGHAVITTNPTAAHPTWKAATIDADSAIQGISCVSASLCVAVGYTVPGGFFHERVAITTNPTAATPTWTAADADLGAAPNAISCTSTTFCLMVDDHGRALVSKDPTAATPTWAPSEIDGIQPQSAVSCVSTSLCVSTGSGTGKAAISKDPGAASPAWKLAQIDGFTPISGISCPTVSFCAAADDRGNALVSTNPTAATPTWKSTHIDGQAPLTGISCPSASFCAAVDLSGNAVVSTNPAAAGPTWTLANIDGIPLDGISCPSAQLCVAVDRGGFAVTSNDPAGDRPGWFITPAGSGYTGGVSCPSTSLCVAVDAGHALVTVDPTADFPTWTSTTLYGGGFSAPPMYAISCPSAGLCAGGNLPGELWVSTNPAAEMPAWTSPAGLGGQTTGISCPSVAFCVAVAGPNGRALVSADPADPLATWTPADIDTPYFLQGVSCVSPALCVAVDHAGQITTGRWEGPLPAAPVASTPPAVTGTATAGELLTATHGTWTNDPTSYVDDWQRCNSSGAACTPIPGASGLTYRLTADDVGHTLRVKEIATSPGGSGVPATSAATAVVKAEPAAPVASAPPAITGTATAGQLLTATHGTWTNSPTSYLDDWQQCNNAGTACTPIPGASGLTYRLTNGDIGHTLRIQEIASGPGGSGAPATSAATPIVNAAPAAGGGGGGTGGGGGGGTGGGGTTGGGGGGGAPPGGGPAPAPALVRATTSGPLARVTISCVAACRLTLTITVTETLRHGKIVAVSAKKRKVVIGKAAATLAAGQRRTVRVSLNKAGRKLLASRRRFKARLAVSQAGSPVSRATLTFRRKPRT